MLEFPSLAWTVKTKKTTLGQKVTRGQGCCCDGGRGGTLQTAPPSLRISRLGPSVLSPVMDRSPVPHLGRSLQPRPHPAPLREEPQDGGRDLASRPARPVGTKKGGRGICRSCRRPGGLRVRDVPVLAAAGGFFSGDETSPPTPPRTAAPARISVRGGSDETPVRPSTTKRGPAP